MLIDFIKELEKNAFSLKDRYFKESDRSEIGYELGQNRNKKADIGITRLTLGGASYIVSGDLASGSSHILVGRYSSLADNIVLNIGRDFGHYLTSAATYPFATINAKQQYEEKIPTVNAKLTIGQTKKNQIIIGNDVWIGSNVTLMGGITIGNGAIIGGSSVVTHNVPPYAIVAGNPARLIRYRFSDEIIRQMQKIKWWYWPDEKIRANLDLMDNPADFCAKFYPEAIEQEKNQAESPLAADLQKIRADGVKIFYFVPDFHRKENVWPVVIEQYLAHCNANTPAALLLELPADGQDFGGVAEVSRRLDAMGENAPCIFTNASPNGEWTANLKAVDYFITTREAESSLGVDYGSDFGVKIKSGLDAGIFDDVSSG